MTTEELIAFVKQRNFCGTCTTRPEGCDSCEKKIAKDMILSSLQAQLKTENPSLLGTWESPDKIPTDIDLEIVPCVVIVQGVQTGTIRVEEADYRYGEWDISNAWNLIAWTRRKPDKSDGKAAQKAITIGESVLIVRCGECEHWKPSGSYGGNTIEDMEPLGGCIYATTCMRASDFCSHGAPKEGNTQSSSLLQA